MCVSAAAPVGAFLLVCTTRGQPGSLRPVTPNVIVSFTGTSIWASGDPSRIPSYGLPGAVSGSQVIFALLERRKSRYVQHALSRSCWGSKHDWARAIRDDQRHRSGQSRCTE